MNIRTRIVCLVVVVAALLGVYRMDNRLNCAPSERLSLVQVIQRVNPSVVYVEAYGQGYDYWAINKDGSFYNWFLGENKEKVCDATIQIVRLWYFFDKIAFCEHIDKMEYLFHRNCQKYIFYFLYTI